MNNILKRRIRYNHGWYTVLQRKDWQTCNGTWLQFKNHSNLKSAVLHLWHSETFFNG